MISRPSFRVGSAGAEPGTLSCAVAVAASADRVAAVASRRKAIVVSIVSLYEVADQVLWGVGHPIWSELASDPCRRLPRWRFDRNRRAFPVPRWRFILELPRRSCPEITLTRASGEANSLARLQTPPGSSDYAGWHRGVAPSLGTWPVIGSLARSGPRGPIGRGMGSPCFEGGRGRLPAPVRLRSRAGTRDWTRSAPMCSSWNIKGRWGSGSRFQPPVWKPCRASRHPGPKLGATDQPLPVGASDRMSAIQCVPSVPGVRIPDNSCPLGSTVWKTSRRPVSC